MSTTSTASATLTAAAKPVTVSVTVPTWVTNWQTLIKAHEKIIIVCILATVSFFAYDKALTVWDKHASVTATQTAVSVKTDATLAKQQVAQIATLENRVATQSALLNKQISQRNAVTTAQQTVDKTLPPSALAQRWQSLIKVAGITPSGVVDPTTGQQFNVTDQAALATVVELESVPTLTANVQALQTELTNDETIISKQQDLITTLTGEIADEKANTVAQVSAQKASDSKSRSRWVKIALIGGAILGGFLGHSI